MHRKHRKCYNCGRSYVPDPRNRRHQKYCAASACRKVSKDLSQARWLKSNEGKTYHTGNAHVLRVRDWRSKNPYYWRRQAKFSAALQDLFPLQLLTRSVTAGTGTNSLKDVSITLFQWLLGVTAHLAGSSKKEIIDDAAKGFILDGRAKQNAMFRNHNSAAQKR